MPLDSGAFMRGFQRRKENQRRSRLDEIQEELQRGQLALQRAAEARQAKHQDWTRDRTDYSDRLQVLGRDTTPFTTLLGKYPGAGASPYVGRAFELDERLARDPSAARAPAMDDPGQEPGDEGPRVPTNEEHREAVISTAYDKFGGEQNRITDAAAALRRALQKQSSPYTRDLEIKLRGVEQKKKQAQALINGQTMDPNGFVRDIMDPEARADAKRQGTAMLAQAVAEERALNAAISGRTGMQSPSMGPAAMAEALGAQGMDPDQIAEQLEQAFSPEEIQAAGF